MGARIELPILPQPDDSTCGPTCLQAVYAYWGDELPLARVISEVHALRDGGTLAVLLGIHALRRGYRVHIDSWNLQIFDPTWEHASPAVLAEKLARQAEAKADVKLRESCDAYREFLGLGGEVALRELTPSLLRGYLKEGIPILTGLSATYLYRSARERGSPLVYDDVAGEPQGHFVVLRGYDSEHHTVDVADPWRPEPTSSHQYSIGMQHLFASILLGIVTYDANLLVIRPMDGTPK